MAIKFSNLCALVLSAFILFGQSAAQSHADEASDKNIGTPAMWRVADADSEFILLGTFHILPPELQWRSPALEDAFAKAETIYFEVDSDNASEQSKATHIIMMQGFNANGGKITDLLTESNATKFRDIIAELGLSVSGIDAFRPWRASLSLAYQSIKNLGFDPESGVESALSAEAIGNGKTLRFFETIEQQAGFFANLSPETELSMLVETIENWEDQDESILNLLAAWRTGDVERLEDEMLSSMKENHPEAYKAIIVDRNKAWAEEIAKAMNAESGPTMVAVGVGHLVGDENSLPALLSAKGFEVSRYDLERQAAEIIPANDNTSQDVADDIGDLLKAVGEE